MDMMEMDSKRSGPTIEAILDGVKAGDPRAINRLCMRIWPVVFGYCYCRLDGPSSAEDAAQNAMIEIVGRAPGIRVPAALWGYARLVARKHCDRQTRTKRIETTPLTEVHDGSRRDPLSEFLEREQMRRVTDALESLPPQQRTSMTLYYLGDYRTDEIAAFLGIRVGTVKKRLADGREKLRGMMAMVEGVMRDFRDLVRMRDRAVQKLIRELPDEDLGRVMRVVGPQIRAKLERNASPRVLERLRNVRRNDGPAARSVERFWGALDALLEAGEIDLVPGKDLPGGETPVAAVAGGPGMMDRAAWLRQALHELSIKSRRHGMFALEHDAQRTADALLREGLQLIVDGAPPETVRERLRAFEGGEAETIVEKGILAIQQGGVF